MNDINNLVPTMTSSELMNVLVNEDNEHLYERKEINKKIRAMFPDEIDRENFSPSLDSRGYVTEYNLPETESTMFVAKYDVKFLKKIVQYWIDRGNVATRSNNLNVADMSGVVDSLDTMYGNRLSTPEKHEIALMVCESNGTVKISDLNQKIKKHIARKSIVELVKKVLLPINLVIKLQARNETEVHNMLDEGILIVVDGNVVVATDAEILLRLT